ncbi:hypothetical protein Tco_0453824 [Tanacetum coccineum]
MTTWRWRWGDEGDGGVEMVVVPGVELWWRDGGGGGSGVAATGRWQRRCSRNTARIMHRTLKIFLVFTVCERQVYWNSVIMRFMDDLLALDSIVRFSFSDRRLEQTATDVSSCSVPDQM